MDSPAQVWEAQLWDLCTPGICRNSSCLPRAPPLLRRSDPPRAVLLLSYCCSAVTTIIPFSLPSSNYSMGKLGIRVILGEFRAPAGTAAQARSPDPREEAKRCN